MSLETSNSALELALKLTADSRPKTLEPNVDYIPGPTKCPGVYNKHPPRGPIITKLVLAIPFTQDEIDEFNDNYWEDCFPRDLTRRPEFTSFLYHFPSRPEGTEMVVSAEIPMCRDDGWEPLIVVVGNNFTKEDIEKAKESAEIAKRIQGYFGVKREPGWYRFKSVV